MSWALRLCVVACCVIQTLGLLCYNCSTTHKTATACGGDFAPVPVPFNDTAKILTNCSADNAMCFVRSWRARARYAWIVQRGCYQPFYGNDSLQKYMDKPTRAMTCTERKLRGADYQVCLCRSDWCNVAPPVPQYYHLPSVVLISTILSIALSFLIESLVL